MDEIQIAQLLAQDYSAGTEDFREDLLGRCLAVLDQADEGTPLSDDEIDFLAAAGNPFATGVEDDLLN